mmetsp:Transcript_21618/g.63459  ORF Transcript_21618/g.63459 Transcript_21618/m.63459 type:complete len:392 (+) Transcript_21618:366-1541(+)
MSPRVSGDWRGSIDIPRDHAPASLRRLARFGLSRRLRTILRREVPKDRGGLHELSFPDSSHPIVLDQSRGGGAPPRRDQVRRTEYEMLRIVPGPHLSLPGRRDERDTGGSRRRIRHHERHRRWSGSVRYSGPRFRRRNSTHAFSGMESTRSSHPHLLLVGFSEGTSARRRLFVHGCILLQQSQLSGEGGMDRQGGLYQLVGGRRIFRTDTVGTQGEMAGAADGIGGGVDRGGVGADRHVRPEEVRGGGKIVDPRRSGVDARRIPHRQHCPGQPQQAVAGGGVRSRKSSPRGAHDSRRRGILRIGAMPPREESSPRGSRGVLRQSVHSLSSRRRSQVVRSPESRGHAGTARRRGRMSIGRERRRIRERRGGVRRSRRGAEFEPHLIFGKGGG